MIDSRAKGMRAEREVVKDLRDLTGWDVKRIESPGSAHDEGDIWGLPDCVLQVADWTDALRAVRQKPEEAEVQRRRAVVPFALSAVRLRGGLWRYVQTPAQAMTLLREATWPEPRNITEAQRRILLSAVKLTRNRVVAYDYQLPLGPQVGEGFRAEHLAAMDDAVRAFQSLRVAA